MENKEMKAKVFISCGQRKDTDEVEIANKIANELNKMGFEPYVATSQQTLRGVKENIFKEIESSEYFIFVDFKREEIITGKNRDHRGSLFSHQELALASYLDLPVIAFQEFGVKKDDGLIHFIQGNSQTFSDRNGLVELVVNSIKSKNWESRWKNQLSISFNEEDFDDVAITNIPEKPMARFFHLRVNNNHLSNPAFNCYAYLVSIKDTFKNLSIPLEIAELKWKGYYFPNALISPQGFRKLDAFFIRRDRSPISLEFNLFTDFTGYMRKVQSPGEFELKYLIISENFNPVEKIVNVKMNSLIENVKIEVI